MMNWDFLLPVVIVGAWIVLNRYLLPRLGIRT